MAPQFIYIGGAVAVASSVEYTDSFTSGTSTTPHTFTGEAIGTADADREVVVLFGWNNNVTVSSATIGGVSATIHYQDTQSSFGMALIQASVPTGTTADVVLTFSGNAQYIAGAVYKVITSTPTPLDVGGNSGTGTTIAVSNLEVSNGGILIAGGFAAIFGTMSALYDGVDTPIVDADNLFSTDTRRLHTWHCSTTENDAGNSPGISTSGSSTRFAAAISFA